MSLYNARIYEPRRYAVEQLVEALRWKTPVRFPLGSLTFFTDFILPAALCSTQPPTEKSTRDLSSGVKTADA